jgi:hypothetical protein
MNKITRFEVIDDNGRVYVNNSCEVELSYQDDDRTLKVFVGKIPNEETLKAFEDVKNSKDLTKCNSVGELFENLEKEEIENFSDEELKTAIGHLMLDLRGSWSSHYKERSLIGISLIKELLKRNPNEPSLLEDLELFEAQSVSYSEYVDGRVFRDNGILYGYSSENGRTERVHKFLKGFLLSPYDNF